MLYEPPLLRPAQTPRHCPVRLRILMIGNSLTYSNDLPGLLEQTSAAEPTPLKVDAITFPLASLNFHWHLRTAQPPHPNRPLRLRHPPGLLPQPHHPPARLRKILPAIRNPRPIHRAQKQSFPKLAPPHPRERIPSSSKNSTQIQPNSPTPLSPPSAPPGKLANPKPHPPPPPRRPPPHHRRHLPRRLRPLQNPLPKKILKPPPHPPIPTLPTQTLKLLRQTADTTIYYPTKIKISVHLCVLCVSVVKENSRSQPAHSRNATTRRVVVPSWSTSSACPTIVQIPSHLV